MSIEILKLPHDSLSPISQYSERVSQTREMITLGMKSLVCSKCAHFYHVGESGVSYVQGLSFSNQLPLSCHTCYRLLHSTPSVSLFAVMLHIEEKTEIPLIPWFRPIICSWFHRWKYIFLELSCLTICTFIPNHN